MELNWLNNVASDWQTGVEQGRIPHAVLLLGAAGTGKRATAAWMAKQRLSLRGPGGLPEYPFEIPAHADLHWISLLEDKHSIGIDQIRALIQELHLTSYEGKGKVAVIDFAHTMTANAANSLLKTLEEPPGDVLIILLVDRDGKLPATIFSRCQRIKFNRPATTESLTWLVRLHPGKDWGKALAAAGGAPLAAISALERLPDSDSLATEFAAVGERKTAPLAIATRWAKYEPAFVLDWLSAEVRSCILRVSGGPINSYASSVPESVLQGVDRRNLFCYLETINRLRAQAVGSFNVQLALESLLIEWSEGLSGVRGSGKMAAAKLSFVHG